MNESVADQIRRRIRSYLTSDFSVDTEAHVWRALAEEHDRSVKRVYNLAAEVKKESHKAEPSVCGDRHLIVSDIHYPYHLEPAVENVYELIENVDFETIVINGDLLDCYSISSYERDPRKPLLAEEIEGAKEILKGIRRRALEADLHFVEGNHEQRLSRLISRNPGLYGLNVLTWPQLLELDEIDCSWTGYRDWVDLYGIQVTHGHLCRKHAGYSAKGHLIDEGYENVIHGHTHRIGSYHLTGVSGTRRAHEIGGLFDRSQADYISNPNWQNGFCVVTTTPENLQITTIEVDPNNGSFLYGGKRYG